MALVLTGFLQSTAHVEKNAEKGFHHKNLIEVFLTNISELKIASKLNVLKFRNFFHWNSDMAMIPLSELVANRYE